MLIILLIVILSLFVAALFAENLPKQYHKYLFWYCVIAFVLLSMTRPGSYVSDYLNYEKYFYSFDDIKTKLIVEATFLWISEFVYNHGGTLRIVIYIYALISIPFKLYSIRKLTNETVFLLSMMIYASNYFMLHDCEQIRLAAGMAFGMYAIYLKVEGKQKMLMALMIIIGISFHHTVAALIIPLLISPKQMNKGWKWTIGILVPVCIGLWILHINPITSLPIPYIKEKLILYEMAIAEGKHPDVRVINIMVLFRIALFYFILYYYDNILPHLKALPILLICDALSIASWFALSEMSVIAVRITQLYGFIEVILFASIYYTIKPSWFGKTFIGLIALYFFAQNYVSNQFGFR